jgi:hypothetical protein
VQGDVAGAKFKTSHTGASIKGVKKDIKVFNICINCSYPLAKVSDLAGELPRKSRKR